MLLLVPGERVADVCKGADFERYLHVWMAVVLALGLRLAALAFAA